MPLPLPLRPATAHDGSAATQRTAAPISVSSMICRSSSAPRQVDQHIVDLRPLQVEDFGHWHPSSNGIQHNEADVSMASIKRPPGLIHGKETVSRRFGGKLHPRRRGVRDFEESDPRPSYSGMIDLIVSFGPAVRGRHMTQDLRGRDASRPQDRSGNASVQR